MEDEKPEQKAPNPSKDHDYVAAIEKQSEEIRGIGRDLQSLADKVTATNQANEDSQQRRHTEQMGVERRFLRWQQAGAIATGALSFFTLAVLAVTLYFAERAVVTFGAADGRLMKMVCQAQGGSVFTYFQNSGKTSAYNVWVQLWPLHDDNQAITVSGYKGISDTQTTIPPGFPYISMYNGVDCADINAIQSEQKPTIIWGRISYSDGFYRNHCQGFAALYYGDPVKDFEIFPADLNLCDGWERQIYWHRVAGTTKGTADITEEVFPTRTTLINGKPIPLKRVLIYLNGYQNTSSVHQTYAYPVPFVGHFEVGKDGY